MQQGSNLRLLTEADYESAALTTQPCMPCTEGELFSFAFANAPFYLPRGAHVPHTRRVCGTAVRVNY